MANEPDKMLERWIQEASDPETDPDRLQELANSNDEDVQRAALKNPNLPEDAWRTALLHGYPEAWANPMAPFYLLSWLPKKDDWRTLEAAALVATESLWEEPERCSVEGKQLLAAKVMEWWATSESAVDMMTFLGRWAPSRGSDSQEHKDVMRILVKCVRTTPHLTQKDLNLLHSIEQWSKGLQKRPPKLVEDNHSRPVKKIHQAIAYCFFGYRFAVDAVLDEVAYNKSKDDDSQAYKEAKKEHDRFLADLIRQEMPVPPTAE
jgi:hypothetical protein